MTALRDLEHGEAAARIRAAADILARQADPAMQAVARDLSRWANAGATRRDWAEIVPPAARGGDLGRGEALRTAISVLRKLRRDHFPNVSNRQAAEFIRAAVKAYAASGYSKNRSAGKFPEADTLEYWAHYFIASSALYRGGKLIEAETIARYLGEENCRQSEFQF